MAPSSDKIFKNSTTVLRDKPKEPSSKIGEAPAIGTVRLSRGAKLAHQSPAPVLECVDADCSYLLKRTLLFKLRSLCIRVEEATT